MKTRRGIYKKLEESDYIYHYKEVSFYFSSLFYYSKFQEELEEFTYKIINIMCKNKILITSNIELLAAVILYSKIEKRGFYIKVNEKEVDTIDAFIMVNIKYKKIKNDMLEEK